MEKIVAHILKQGIEKAEHEAFVVDDLSVTYGELSDNILRAAHLLKEEGINRGDKVIIAALMDPVYVYLYFAIHLVGAVAVPVEKSVRQERIQYLSDIVQPRKVYVGEDFPDCINMTTLTLPPERYPYREDELMADDTVSDILFTTGTTGQSKGVMLTHRCIVYGAQNVIEGGDMKQADRNLLPMPLYHAYGLTTLRAVFLHGATAVLQDGFTSIRKMHMNIHKRNCNCVYLMPSAIPMLEIQTGNNLGLLLGGLDKIEFCTAPLEKQMRMDLLDRLPGVRIYNSYGATEAARTVYMKISEDRLASIGKPVSNARICIVNDELEEVKAGETGRLCISGGMVMKGYFADEKLTQEVLREGRFYTSDVGYMDKEGYIFLLGRSQDIMNIGGEKVAPSEIEAVAYELDFIKECACIAIPDPDSVRGEVPILYFSVKKEKEDDTRIMKEQFEKQLERFKWPYNMVRIAEIPKNELGKIDRNKLRELARSEYGDRSIS